MAATTLVMSCYGVEIRLVDASGSGLTRTLPDSLPPECTVDPGYPSQSEVLYELSEGRGAQTQRAWRLSRDGEHCLETSSEAELLRWLTGDIDRAIAERSADWLFVHAGVVSWKGHAIVIPGRSMAGKSTLVAALVREGATYYSDEYAVLDASGHVHPYRRPLVLRGVHGERQGAALYRSGESGPKEPLPLALVLAAPYQASTVWSPRIVRGTRAALPLIDCTVMARAFPAKTLALAASLASSITTLQGPRGEVEEVAPQVLDVMDAALALQADADDDDDTPLGAHLVAAAERRLGTRVAPLRHVIAPRYLRIEDFLTAEEHQRLLAFALAHEAAFESSVLVADPETDGMAHGRRRSRTLYDLDEIWDMFQKRLCRMLPFVRKELGLGWFALDQIERQLTAHADGGFYHAHRDNAEEEVASRRLTAVYHFHARPQRFRGGELRLYDTFAAESGQRSAPTFTSLEPLDNSIVFFPSDALHEVCAVHRDTSDFRDCRFAVNVWFRQAPALPLSS